MKLRIATRTSQLALWQAHFVMTKLQECYPDWDMTCVGIVSEGDRQQHVSLAQLGGKGLFIKKLEESLLDKEADMAVHSLKDIPPQLESVFTMPAMLKREAPNDVFLSLKANSLASLPSGSLVGTASVRRQAFLWHQRPDLRVQTLRGNINTRIKKLMAGDYDAIILAYAGLKRLNFLALEKINYEILPLERFLPSVGQGIIAVECLAARTELVAALRKIDDRSTHLCARAERSLTQHLGASCTSPVGSHAVIKNNQLLLTGWVASPDGRIILKHHQQGSPVQAEQLGALVAEALIKQGAKQILAV